MNNTGVDYSTIELKPIDDLKVGERLIRSVGGMSKYPKVGDIVRVHRLDFPQDRKGLTDVIGRWDFTYLIKLDGDIVEFSGDSRYFERV